MPHLGELYDIIRSFTRSEGSERRRGLLERLQEIEIDAPEDFAASFDLYVSGEKGAGPSCKGGGNLGAPASLPAH